MVLCVCCAYDRWPVYTELIPGLGDAAHDLSFSWRISPRTAVLRSAAMASGFRKRSFLYTGCFGGSVCNASDRIAHPGYRHSDASWGSTVDLCRFFKPDSNSTRSLDLTFFQSKRIHKVFCSSKRYAIIKLDKIPLFKRFLRNFPVALLVSKIRD